MAVAVDSYDVGASVALRSGTFPSVVLIPNHSVGVYEIHIASAVEAIVTDLSGAVSPRSVVLPGFTVWELEFARTNCTSSTLRGGLRLYEVATVDQGASTSQLTTNQLLPAGVSINSLFLYCEQGGAAGTITGAVSADGIIYSAMPCNGSFAFPSPVSALRLRFFLTTAAERTPALRAFGFAYD